MACALLGYAFFNMGSGFANSSNTVKLATSEMVSAIKQDRVEDLTSYGSRRKRDGSLLEDEEGQGRYERAQELLLDLCRLRFACRAMAEYPDTKYIVNTNDPDFWATWR
ncbi:MAG: hypothetical protein ACLU0O_09180 [Collinsella sp.]